MLNISDTFGRTFKTLRVSLTNTCNLACAYCVDPATAGIKTLKSPSDKKALNNIEYIEIIRVLHKLLGLETIRLTGGEPTLYKQLIPLLHGLSPLGIPEIKMTSNGYLLANKAFELKKAGLSSINISLDAIDSDVFFNMSQRKHLEKVLSGIDQSIEAGIKVKINCVVMKGFNHTQIPLLLDFCKKRNITIRFLEVMQMGHLHDNFDNIFFSEAEILKTISNFHEVTASPRDTNATAKYWTMDDGYTFGIISNESDPFCNDCNRLRLDSYGNIYGCLSDNTPINLIDSIHDERLVGQKLTEALQQKKMKFSGSELSMLHIGG